MTGYGAAHLGIAALCAAMALVHGFLWVMVPRDRTQLWVAISFLAFAALNGGIAGSGLASGHALGMAAAWVVVSFAGAFALWPSIPMLVWTLLNRPRSAGRRALLAGLIGIGALRLAEVVAYLAGGRASEPVFWERVVNTKDLWTMFPAKLAYLTVATVWTWEGVSALRRNNRTGWLVLLSGIPTVGLVAREALIAVAVLEGPTLIGLAGLPFVLSTSLLLALRYAQAARDAGAHGTDEVGGYRLIRRLAAGGMGELFLAARTGPGGFQRHVALKRVLTARTEVDARSVERLLAEARTCARLSHPNIIAVHDVGQVAGGWFIVMEYLSGVDLARIRDRALEAGRAIPAAFAVTIGEQIARGLAHAHAAGVVHRDVSPHNVMMTFDGVAKLIDFGVAADGTTDFDEGLVVGKTSYLPPEQLRGEEADPASDVYALGVTLYELLAGERPFKGADSRAIARAVLAGRFRPIAEIRADLTPALAAIVDRAISPDRARRFHTADALRGALSDVAREQGPCDPGLLRTFCPREFTAQRRLEFLESVDDASTKIFAAAWSPTA